MSLGPASGEKWQKVARSGRAEGSRPEREGDQLGRWAVRTVVSNPPLQPHQPARTKISQPGRPVELSAIFLEMTFESSLAHRAPVERREDIFLKVV